MGQPEGFVIHGQEKKLCMLNKTIYGLKQSPTLWHENFGKLTMSDDFRVN